MGVVLQAAAVLQVPAGQEPPTPVPSQRRWALDARRWAPAPPWAPETPVVRRWAPGVLPERARRWRTAKRRAARRPPGFADAKPKWSVDSSSSSPRAQEPHAHGRTAVVPTERRRFAIATHHRQSGTIVHSTQRPYSNVHAIGAPSTPPKSAQIGASTVQKTPKLKSFAESRSAPRAGQPSTTIVDVGRAPDQRAPGRGTGRLQRGSRVDATDVVRKRMRIEPTS